MTRKIYEWDGRHGRIEQYSQRGDHEGEFDYMTGAAVHGPSGHRIVV